MTKPVVLIAHTTLYREGGPKFARAAATMARERGSARPDAEVVLAQVESKRDFVDSLERVSAAGQQLAELHFIGHSGIYGPMFRTTEMPEQFSPHEWRNLVIPFAADGEAYFHACRSARWFAPFFARTFGVPASGYHWYTTVSLAPDRFEWDRLGDPSASAPLYVIGCQGRKSHGLAGAAAKYAGAAVAEKLKRFQPEDPTGDPTYDAIAPLYDEVFQDIGVRGDEWNWLAGRLPRDGQARVLDLGCGNGALLLKMAKGIAAGVGLDASPIMIELARRRAAAHPHLSFVAVREPILPFADASFDVVTSLLSFRYLDWDPIMNEIRRVLKPGGRFLVVDMITAPVRLTELPAFARGKLRQLGSTFRHRRFNQALRRLVRDPRWQTMLRYNPIRAEHEFKWYLESRFPGQKVNQLNVGWHARVLAFDSGPLEPGTVPPQSYP